MNQKDCLFCKIIKGVIPSYKIYEDKENLAFLDINPLTRGHTLIIPKKHYQNIFEIDKEDLKNLIIIIQKLAKKLKKDLKADGINIFQSNGKDAEQEIPHLHFHIVPRYKKDNLKFWPERKYNKEDFEKVLEEIT